MCSFFLILLKRFTAAVQNTAEKSWATEVTRAICGGPSLLTPSWGSSGVVVMRPPCPGLFEFWLPDVLGALGGAVSPAWCWVVLLSGVGGSIGVQRTLCYRVGDDVAGSGKIGAFISPCASLAWGLLLLSFVDDLLPFMVYVCLGLLWPSGVAYSCPLMALGAVVCRPSTILATNNCAIPINKFVHI